MLESSHYLKTLIETMQDGLMVVDLDGEIVSVNRALEELTGYGRDELIGSPCSILQCDACFKSTESGRERHCELFLSAGFAAGSAGCAPGPGLRCMCSRMRPCSGTSRGRLLAEWRP